MKIMIYEFVRKCELGYSRKNPNSGVELRAWNFRGYWKKRMWKFQGSVKIEMGFQSVFTKNLRNFHGSWFLTLEFPRGLTQFCRISRDKVTNLKILGFFFSEKYILIPFFCIFFWNSPLVLENLLPYQVSLL